MLYLIVTGEKQEAEMFGIIYCDEVIEQINNLDRSSKKKVFKDIEKFKAFGRQAVNSRNLENNLWEIKTDNIRIYYAYEKEEIIIIGLIVLKKSQKAPKRFIEQALRNIEKMKLQLKNNKE